MDSDQLMTLRETIQRYIGGGWGKDIPDDQHPLAAWVIRGTDFGGARLGDVSTCPLRYHKESNLRSRRLQPSDIVFEVSGGSKDQPVGRSLLVTDSLLGRFAGDVICASFCKLVRPDANTIDASYLFWLMQAMYDDRSIVQFQVQSTGISNFRFEDFLDNLVVDVPPLATQRRIATVLASYDELIENNTRRIQILEEMAQAIYREWFVEFRYPGHEDVPLVDSDLGPIPEGWEWQPLFDVAVPTFGFAFKSKQFNTEGDGVPVIRIRDLPKNGSQTFTRESAATRYEVDDGDLLVGMDGDFHMCMWSAGPAYLNQRVVRFRPQDDSLSRYEIFLGLKRPIQELNQSIVGTTVAHLGKRHLELLRLAVPTEGVRNQARAVFDPLFDLVIGLRKANRNLRTTRDLLLPRLISGEIDVSDLDIDAGDAAA